jgi:hypothetical protein
MTNQFDISFVCVYRAGGLLADNNNNNNLIAPLSANQHVVRVTAAGPRFQNELPSEVTFTPDRGFTLDCPVWANPPPQINWLTSKGIIFNYFNFN